MSLFRYLILCSLLSYCEGKILFLHIPKSGGITVSSIFLDHFAMERTYRLEWHKFDPFDLQKRLADIDLLYGHTPYQILDPLSKDFWKATFLRDPVERVLSEQRYVMDRKHIDPDAKAVRCDHLLPLVGDPIDTASNVACKMLSRLNPFDPAIPIERHLESAKEVLANEFDFVGITERMEESIELLSEQLGWSVPEEIPIHNTTPSFGRIYSQEILEGIERRNWADRQLYAFAQELFEEQIQKRKLSFLPERSLEWRSEVIYDFREPLDGCGWCPRERWGEDIFRWLSSSERGRIEFALLPDDYVLEFELLIHRNLIKKIAFFAGGSLLAHKISHFDPSSAEYRWCTVKAFLPKTYIGQGQKTELMIAILDKEYTAPKDSYRGRCGSKKITIRRSVLSQ